jgi:hypothetical protein
VGALTLSSCASLPRQPAPAVFQAALAARTYSAELNVSLRGRELRGRSRILLACARPDSLRIEIPGPTGARLVAVARAGRLSAVFPAERAVYESDASAAELEALLGIALTPSEVMDLLLGQPPASVRASQLGWGPRVPLRVETTLSDGARLQVRVGAPRVDEDLPQRAFEAQAHAGYRTLTREEARSLWMPR